MMVYVATDRPLPLIEWQDQSPSFYVSELAEDEKRVIKQFSKPFVYYVGSHQGCGCGFSYGQWPVEDEDDRTEDAAARESVKRLSEYLSNIVQHAEIELFVCWDGDQEAEPEYKSVITPAEIGGEAFEFKEKQFLTITKV